MAVRALVQIEHPHITQQGDVHAHHCAQGWHTFTSTDALDVGWCWVLLVIHLAGEVATHHSHHLLRLAVPNFDNPHPQALLPVHDGHLRGVAVEAVLLAVHGLVAQLVQPGIVGATRCGGAQGAAAVRENRLGNIEVQPLGADDIAAVGEVFGTAGAIPQHIAPTLVAHGDRLAIVLALDGAFHPAHTNLDRILERAGAVEGRHVDVAQVLHELGLALGRLGGVLAAGEDLVIGAAALLGTQYPVHGTGDDVVDQWHLAPVAQLLGILLAPLDVVVEIGIDSHIDPVL